MRKAIEQDTQQALIETGAAREFRVTLGPGGEGWTQAPEGTTHHALWLKLGEPAERELWRRPGGRNWRPGVDWSVSGCDTLM